MTAVVERFAGHPCEWNAFVRSCPGWSPFHLYEWSGVMERVFGHECAYLVSRSDAPGRPIAGVLPLVRVRSPWFGHYLVSMPFVNHGGPLGGLDAVHSLATHAVALARAQRVDLLELRSRHELRLDLRPSHRKITCLLDLEPGDAEAVWRRLASHVRRKVRRAQKEGLTLRFGADQVSPFHEVFARHMRDLGTPTLPRRFFQALADQFAGVVWVGCAYAGERPVAGGCGFRWDDELELTWVSALQSYHRVYASMLLHWAFIEGAAAEGLRTFNFGRCSPGSGTHQFKRQWGTRDVPLWWYQHSSGRRQATPSPDERGFAWGPRLWKRLPLPLANRLGPLIVRSIP